ncbi:MAG TPA: IS21 family transposase [Treponemataceae bacterium]|nr:IS21 family transposase [Treponemataceae bacterium]
MTDAQVRKLMEEKNRHGKMGLASMTAGMDRKTGRKYWRAGTMPSAMEAKRDWRTREDPFEEDWPLMAAKLADAPTLEGKALFEWLMEERPGKYAPGQVRTFQRRVERWRAQSGPEREVFFAQEHRPGEAMQTDFTWATELGVTICGEAFPHMLCHPVLPYSNWEWATVCRSESFLAISRGVQAALFRLGKRPKYHQTDHSTAATHDLKNGSREFNDEYKRFIEHFGMAPRTIAVGKSNQNGDVEASNGALKRCLEQHLLLRGSRDFESVEAYEAWVQGLLARNNARRSAKVSEELSAMTPLAVSRLPEHTTEDVRVSRESTIRVKHNTYSVPSRLIEAKVKVRLYDDRLEVWYGGARQLEVERLLGRHGHRIDYHHVIWSLVKKPGAFSRYRYREELFPSLEFRRAYDALNEALGAGYKADAEYLRILHRSASVSETDVEAALALLREAGETPLADKVKELVQPREAEVPAMAPYAPNLAEYDALLAAAEEVGA